MTWFGLFEPDEGLVELVEGVDAGHGGEVVAAPVADLTLPFSCAPRRPGSQEKGVIEKCLRKPAQRGCSSRERLLRITCETAGDRLS